MLDISKSDSVDLNNVSALLVQSSDNLIYFNEDIKSLILEIKTVQKSSEILRLINLLGKTLLDNHIVNATSGISYADIAIDFLETHIASTKPD